VITVCNREPVVLQGFDDNLVGNSFVAVVVNEEGTEG
jgi:hypothetical protein